MAYLHLTEHGDAADRARMDVELEQDTQREIRLRDLVPVSGRMLRVAPDALGAAGMMEVRLAAYEVARAGRPLLPPHRETPSTRTIPSGGVQAPVAVPVAAPVVSEVDPATLPDDAAGLMALMDRGRQGVNDGG